MAGKDEPTVSQAEEEVQLVCDQIYELLQRTDPPIPETGWVGINIEAFCYAGPGVNWLAEAVRKRHDDRYEIGYMEARLRREEPWPVEVSGDANLSILTALYLLREEGVPSAGISPITEVSGYAASTVLQNMRWLVEIGVVSRVGHDSYQLLVAGDREFWFRDRRGRGRLLTLEQEKARRKWTVSMVSQTAGHHMPADAATLTAFLEMIQESRKHHEDSCAYHQECLKQLEEQEKKVRELLGRLSGQE